jgi:hypothetical protein
METKEARMRRTLLVFALAALAAAALTAGASAKEGGVELSSAPFGLGPGDPWNGTLTVFSDTGFVGAVRPSITIRNMETGETQTFEATAPAKVPTTENTRSFAFEVIFPATGRYRYTATDGVSDREYEFPIVRIVGAESPATLNTPATPTSEGSFPFWALIGSLGGAVALGLAAFLAVRSKRFAH